MNCHCNTYIFISPSAFFIVFMKLRLQRGLPSILQLEQGTHFRKNKLWDKIEFTVSESHQSGMQSGAKNTRSRSNVL